VECLTSIEIAHCITFGALTYIVSSDAKYKPQSLLFCVGGHVIKVKGFRVTFIDSVPFLDP